MLNKNRKIKIIIRQCELKSNVFICYINEPSTRN